MQVVTGNIRLVIPTGYSDRTQYGFIGKGFGERLDICRRSLPPGVPAGSILQRERKKVLNNFGAQVFASGIHNFSVNRRPVSMLRVKHRLQAGAYVCHRVEAVLAGHSLASLAYIAPEGQDTVRRFEAILQSIACRGKQQAPPPRPGFIRCTIGSLVVDIPETLEPPQDYLLTGARGLITFEISVHPSESEMPATIRTLMQMDWGVGGSREYGISEVPLGDYRLSRIDGNGCRGLQIEYVVPGGRSGSGSGDQSILRAHITAPGRTALQIAAKTDAQNARQMKKDWETLLHGVTLQPACRRTRPSPLAVRPTAAPLI